MSTQPESESAPHRYPRISAPKCRFCGREWMPRPGEDATLHYCHDPECSKERRRLAKEVFGPRITIVSADGRYLLTVPVRDAKPDDWKDPAKAPIELPKGCNLIEPE